MPIRVTRNNRLAQSLRITKRRDEQAVVTALEAGAEAMRQLCPRAAELGPDGVHLVDTIKVEGNTVSCLGRGIYPEFGTVNMDAQPFFRPGLDTARRSLQAQFGAAGGAAAK